MVAVTHQRMILLAHTAIEGMGITDAVMRETLGDAAGDELELVHIEPCIRAIDDFSGAALWADLAARQRELFDERLRPLLWAQPDRTIVYFGMTPIPLAVHLGALIGQGPPVIARLRHHETRTWVWPQQRATQNLLRDWPPLDHDSSRTGEATILVHTSYEIAHANVKRATPLADKALDVRVHNFHPDAIASAEDLDAVATSFKQGFDHVANAWPRVGMWHLFASVPVGLALRLGTALNPNIHTPLQTWQYLGRRQDRFRKAILIGEKIEPARVLVLGASPRHERPISAAVEVQEIMDILALRNPDVESVSRLATTVDDLGSRLLTVDPSFIHFAGHGRRGWAPPAGSRDLVPPEPSTWVLHDAHEPEEVKLVEIPDLVELLAGLSRVALVVVTACHGEELVEKLAAPGRIVIGFRGPLDDAIARTFSRAFWKAMVDGQSVARAFCLGRMAIDRFARDFALLRPADAGHHVYLAR
jgi:hypothetical protein